MSLMNVSRRKLGRAFALALVLAGYGLTVGCEHKTVVEENRRPEWHHDRDRDHR